MLLDGDDTDMSLKRMSSRGGKEEGSQRTTKMYALWRKSNYQLRLGNWTTLCLH